MPRGLYWVHVPSGCMHGSFPLANTHAAELATEWIHFKQDNFRRLVCCCRWGWSLNKLSCCFPVARSGTRLSCHWRQMNSGCLIRLILLQNSCFSKWSQNIIRKAPNSGFLWHQVIWNLSFIIIVIGIISFNFLKERWLRWAYKVGYVAFSVGSMLVC